MTTETITIQGRIAAERRMTDAVTITRASGEKVLNPVTGLYETETVQVYSGKALVKIGLALAGSDDAAGREVFTQRAELHLPVDGTSNIRVGDKVSVTSSQLDDGMEGVVFTVLGLHWKTYATARRLEVESVS